VKIPIRISIGFENGEKIPIRNRISYRNSYRKNELFRKLYFLCIGIRLARMQNKFAYHSDALLQ
jgi:hypothetical protein